MTTTRCPVCFAVVNTPICPTCGADVRLFLEALSLEKTRLPESLHKYLQLNRPQAAARILGVLAEDRLQKGQWRSARQFLEGIIALGEEAVGTATRAAVQRQLGGLVARLGDLDLAYHLLHQAEAVGDPQAPLERVRLAVQQKNVVAALRDTAIMDAPLDVNLQAAAWLAEGLVRVEDQRAEAHISAVLGAAEVKQDQLAVAIARRALGLWQVAHGDHTLGQLNLLNALDIFQRLHDPYEVARTRVDLAHAVLLEPASIDPQYWELQPYLERARSLLDEAVLDFRRLGTPDIYASRLLAALSIERSAPPLGATASAVGLIWLDVPLDEGTQQVLRETITQQGGSIDPVLDGWAIVFGISEPFEEPHVLLEAALTVHEVILRLEPNQLTRYRMVAMTGLLPVHSSTVIHHTQLFKRARWQAAQIPFGIICVEQGLAAELPYRLEPLAPSSDENSYNADWYRLLPPVAVKRPPLHRSQLIGYDTILTTIDEVLHRLQQKKLGGMVAISGAPGTGKSRLLDLYIQETKTTAHIWLIHLYGSQTQQFVPFGAIQQWLGTELATKANTDSRERKLAYVASFRQSLLALLYNRPVLLVIDNMHLLDSASLQTLAAILPLIATHPLILLVTAQSEADDRWQALIRTAQHGLPERTLHLTLPGVLAKVRHDLPADIDARRVLECAAILGDRFPIPALRRMAGVQDLTRHLHDFQTTQFLVPTDDPYIWRFTQSAEREAIYQSLLPEYRAMLHWYARQALAALHYPVDDHAHHSGIPRAGLIETLIAAESARQFDAPQEALIHYDRALTHTSNPDAELILARVEALLSLQNWNAAQETLQFMRDKPDLDRYDHARVLIYKGMLSQQMGEIGTLLKLYEEAGSLLRLQTPSPLIQKEALRLVYAQAMARYKRGEMEIARSLVGSGLLQSNDFPFEAAQLWELLANIHRVRREPMHARRAIEQALNLRRSAEYHWLLIEPLEMLGNLLAAMGEMSEAQKQLTEALELATGIGDHLTTIRLRHRLGQLASYRGDFDMMIQHYQEALVIARFAEHPFTLVSSHAVLAEALAYKGDHVQAFYHATGAVQLAHLLENDQAGTAVAYLAQARAALSAGWYDAALETAEKAKEMILFSQNMILHLQLHVLRMETGLAKNDIDIFEKALRDAREITPMMGDQLLRGRIALLVAQRKALEHEWNTAVHEAERASQTFAGIGATYWEARAEAMIKDLAVKAPDYVRSSAKYKT